MKANHSKVKAWEDKILIPTYKRGSEDQNPPILINRRNFIHPGSSIIYPYPMQDNLTDICEDRYWNALFLENDFLLIIVLPELGGHILSVLDKATEEEALYRNHVLKFNRIGIRGAWVSGGIEWNFPNGHTVTTSSPIDYTIRENENGSMTVFISDIERVSRMKWSVGITLYPAHAFFETEIRLFNRTSLPNRFWFWANSAAPASEGLEFITTSSKVMTLTDVLDFPVHNGVDISWDKNHKEAQDLFSLNPKDDFVAWYNHDIDRGMINHADRYEARGKKFFTWGNSDDGKIWTDLLTDNDGPYAEMQSGRLRTMRIWEILPPFITESWKETWYPISKIGSPVYANREACLSYVLVNDKNRAHIGVWVTSPRYASEITLRIDNQNVWSEKIDLEPQSPFTIEVPVKKSLFTGKKTILTLTDKVGKIIAEYTKVEDRTDEVEIKEYYKIEPSMNAVKAEELWRNGIAYEKLGESEMAQAAYANSLKDDPEFSPAHLSLGVLYLRRGKYNKAFIEFNSALKRDENDEGARFFLGVSYIYAEQFEKSIKELLTLSRSQTYGAAASYLLGGLYLGQGKLNKAIEHLEKSQKIDPENLDARAFLACAFRKRQEFNQAQSFLLSILKEDATNFLALAESYFVAVESESDTEKLKAEQKIKRILRDEVQSYLELALDYTRFGLYGEGIKILLLFIEDQNTSPLIYYYMGSFLEKINKSEEARSYFRLGSEKEPSFVFPHRLESERVLRQVIKVLPDDGKAMYYLGNLLCAKNRPIEAIEFWENAKEKLKGYSVLHRKLGRAYWRKLKDPDRALEEYERALEYAPEDYRLYYELDKLYEAYGLPEKRRHLIKRIPKSLRKNDIVAERAASFYTHALEFDKALAILSSIKFFPWEFYTEGRKIYDAANIGKGLILMSQEKYKEAIECFRAVMKYPRNIGVGEPARKSHAEVLYRIGLAYEKQGNSKTANKFYKQTLNEKHTEWNALRYYEAKALQHLAKNDKAESLLDDLLAHTQKSLSDKLGDEAENLYLIGLACKGKGNSVKALQYFKRAIVVNNSHRRSLWEIDRLVQD